MQFPRRQDIVEPGRSLASRLADPQGKRSSSACGEKFFGFGPRERRKAEDIDSLVSQLLVILVLRRGPEGTLH